MTKQELIKNYLQSGGQIIILREIDYLREGGTCEITANCGKFYVAKGGQSFHIDYPPSEGNKVCDPGLHAYLAELIGKRILLLEQYTEQIRETLSQLA